MLCKEVQNYIAAAKGQPFFYVVGDKDYSEILDELKQQGLKVVRISDFCFKDDKYPSIDELIDYFRTSDVDYRDNKFVVVGLGEYLAIRGKTVADKELSRLKSTTLGNARVVLLLRGVGSVAKRIIESDLRMVEQQRAFISDSFFTNIAVTIIPSGTGTNESDGMKAFLRKLEGGSTDMCYVSTALILDNSLFPVKTISDSFSSIRLILSNFTLDKSLGTEEQWSQLLKDIKKNNNSIREALAKTEDDLISDFYLAISGYEYRNWLAFIFLKFTVNSIDNSYLRYVIERTASYEELKNNLLTMIVHVSHKDRNFMKLYSDRKKLVKDFPEADIAAFLRENEINTDESIYKYTDNTEIERKAIVKWISTHGINDAVTYVYPALNAYLDKYIFPDGVLSKELTVYFNEYKRLKVTNQITDEFMALVENNASELNYTQLPTRDNAIKALKDKENTYLYWIDALGVEYLSYVVALAKKKGLSVSIDIVRSDLPTITRVNRNFFESWTGGRKYKESKLDEIKHKEEGGYFFTDEEAPIHIPAELKVIEDAISTAAMELSWHHCRQFVIASDHGASRLAVIKKQEVKYDTDTKGEHSGRCCAYFDGCDLPYAINDGGFIILSDYGRFRKSRAANVEVHGGASLEEIVVPLITLTLRKQGSIKIEVVNKDKIFADRRKGVLLPVYISDVNNCNNIRIVIEEKEYSGKTLDPTHYEFCLSDIKRAKKEHYQAAVFDGDDLIGNISFKVNSKTGSVNDDFDDFGDDF